MKNIDLTMNAKLAATIVAATFAVTGCNNAAKDAPKVEGESKTETTSPSSVESNGEKVLRRGNGAEPQSLDPQLVTGEPGHHIMRDLFEGLVMENAKGELVPGVAESWEVSEDGLTYTFKLRETTWTNGEPLKASDFVYAWQRGVDPATGSNYSFMLYPIKNAEAISNGDIKDLSQLGVKAVSDYELEVTLENLTPYFLSMLTHSLAYPVPEAVVKEHGKDWTKKENIVTNGAFSMVDWTPQSSMELAKSTTYWDKNSVKLDKVMFYPTEDENSEFKRFRAGELDYTFTVPSGQLKLVKDKHANQYNSAPSLSVYYYGLNTEAAPFKDNIALRKALAYAVDRSKITDKVLGEGQTPAYGVVVPGVNNAKPYLPEYAKLSQEERIAKAKEFYKEAGYSAEKPLELDLLYNTNESHKKIAIAVSSMWKENLGVKVNLTNQEWKVYLSTRREGKTQAFRAAWGGDYNDANTFLEMWRSDSDLNDVGFNSKNFDDLLAKSTKEKDLTKRADILNQAEKELIDDFSVLPLYFYVKSHLITDKLKGYEKNVMDHHPSKYMSIED